MSSQKYTFDLIAQPGAKEGSVITALSKLLSIPASDIATIGDMPNDVLMFVRAAGDGTLHPDRHQLGSIEGVMKSITIAAIESRTFESSETLAQRLKSGLFPPP
jgi:hypothetical protein